jgi:hypothetical protein
MSDLDTGLVNQYLTRIHQLAVKEEAGEDIRVALGNVVAEAVDHFAKVFNPGAQLDYFIGQLKFNAELFVVSQPAHADVLQRAAEMASHVNAQPEA